MIVKLCTRALFGANLIDPCFDCRFHFEFIAQRGSSYFFQGLSRAKHLELLASYNDAVCMLATPLFWLLMLYQELYHQLTCMYPVYALKLSYLFPYQKLSTNIIIQSKFSAVTFIVFNLCSYSKLVQESPHGLTFLLFDNYH